MDQDDFFSRDFHNTSTAGSTFELLNNMSQNDFIHETPGKFSFSTSKTNFFQRIS